MSWQNNVVDDEIINVMYGFTQYTHWFVICKVFVVLFKTKNVMKVSVCKALFNTIDAEYKNESSKRKNSELYKVIKIMYLFVDFMHKIIQPKPRWRDI